MTKPIDPTDDFTLEVFDYLNDIRKEGAYNMMHGPQLLEQAYGFSREDARAFFIAWTKSFNKND